MTIIDDVTLIPLGLVVAALTFLMPKLLRAMREVTRFESQLAACAKQIERQGRLIEQLDQRFGAIEAKLDHYAPLLRARRRTDAADPRNSAR